MKDSEKQARNLLLEIFSRKRGEIARAFGTEDSHQGGFLHLLRKGERLPPRYFFHFFKETLASGDSSIFLGHEAYKCSSFAGKGRPTREILDFPLMVRGIFADELERLVQSNDVDPRMAMVAMRILNDLVDGIIRARVGGFVHAKDEALRSFESQQEEIDSFPKNLAATLDIQILCRSAVRKYRELTGAGKCVIFKKDRASGHFLKISASFDFEGLLGKEFADIDSYVEKEFLSSGKPFKAVGGLRRFLPLLSSLMADIKVRSALLVPLMVKSVLTGMVLLEGPPGRKFFTEQEVSIATRFSNRFAIALENARLHNLQQKKLREAVALLEALKLVSSMHDTEMIFSRLESITASVCESCACAVYTYEESSGTLRAHATIDEHSTLASNPMSRLVSIDQMPEDEYYDLFILKRVHFSSAESSAFLSRGSRSEPRTGCIMVLPLTCRDNVRGVLALFYPRNKDEIEEYEVSLVTAIAGQGSAALENVALYEDLEEAYFSTVEALARAMEAKDPYTWGHSERVTKYALAIARRMGLSEYDQKNLRFAAVLHDIGKIGVPGSILKKMGSLTDDELKSIFTHPLVGEAIVEPVGFLGDASKIMLQHHERYDGRGYPLGLRGEEINLGSRILSIADAFEAMLSDRPYRKALSFKEAVRELKKHSGSQFDPEVVEVFLDILASGELNGVFEPRNGKREWHE